MLLLHPTIREGVGLLHSINSRSFNLEIRVSSCRAKQYIEFPLIYSKYCMCTCALAWNMCSRTLCWCICHFFFFFPDFSFAASRIARSAAVGRLRKLGISGIFRYQVALHRRVSSFRNSEMKLSSCTPWIKKMRIHVRIRYQKNWSPISNWKTNVLPRREIHMMSEMLLKSNRRAATALYICQINPWFHP